MERLSKEFDDKYTIKDLADVWHKLSTHFQRESVKQDSSLKSGAGKEDVYESDWPFFFSSLDLLKTNCAHVNEKTNSSKRTQEEEKENAMELQK